MIGGLQVSKRIWLILMEPKNIGQLGRNPFRVGFLGHNELCALLTFQSGIVFSPHDDLEAKQWIELTHQEIYVLSEPDVRFVVVCLWKAVNDIVLLEIRVEDCELVNVSAVFHVLHRVFAYDEVVPNLVTRNEVYKWIAARKYTYDVAWPSVACSRRVNQRNLPWC